MKYGGDFVVEFKEDMKKELETTLKQWKEYVKSCGKKDEHYDLTNDSWWVKTGRLIQEKANELERTTGSERIRELLKDIFRMGKEPLLWAQNVGLIITFLDAANPDELETLRQLILEMKKSNSFSNEWIDRFYSLLEVYNPEKVSKFVALKALLHNILGELYGKLHIEEAPVYNTCSREFVAQYFNFDQNDYEDFRNAFEQLKQEYLDVVGRLSEDNVPINAEIDMMFNFFNRADWRVKTITRTLRIIMLNCHHSWLQIKDELEEHLEKARELLLELLDKEEISEEDVSKLYEIIEKIEKDTRWGKLFQEGYTVMYTKDMYQTMQLLGNPNLRKFLRDVWDAESLDKVLGNKSWKDAWNAKPAGGTVLTSLATILRPDLFLPIHAGTVDERLIRELKLKPKFYYPKGKSSIKQTGEFLEIMYKVAESLQVENMLEIAYYLAYQNECTNNNEGIIPEKFRKSIQTQLDRKSQVILYGPPGTGKTWLARNYVVEKTGEEKPGNRWEFITFHQSYSYEEFIEGFRPKTDESGNIKYVVEDGIFKRMAIQAVWSTIDDTVKFDALWSAFLEIYPKGSILETKTGKKFQIISGENDKIETLPVLGRNNNPDIITRTNLEQLWKNRFNINGPSDVSRILGSSVSGMEPYYFGVLKELERINNEEPARKAYNYIKSTVINALRQHKTGIFNFKDAPKFYLIIDEINRGNISKILGELITLLEKDKRLGAEYPLIVTLPYSGEPFAVPPNLYIIGTMNTADRSIALLDVALRRRFAFIEIDPDSEYLKDKEIEVNGNKVNLKDLLDTINTHIAAVKDRDHRIGHSYFLSVNNIKDLRHVWYYEVLPLLMEYFYNDWETIKWVLNRQFIKEIGRTQDDEPIYDVDIIEDDEKFVEALQKVLPNEGGVKGSEIEDEY